MSIPEDVKIEIDNMSYYDLLKKWRFAPSGDPILSGKMYQYFTDAMGEKREKEDDPTEISRLVGWRQ